MRTHKRKSGDYSSHFVSYSWQEEAQFSCSIKCLMAFAGAVNGTERWSGYCLTLLSGLKISGWTFTASLMAATPLAAGEVAEMMAYATPGLAVETLGTGRGGGVISPWRLDILSGLKVPSPWLLGLTTAVPRARLSGWPDCCSWHGLWGRLSGIRVFGLTCIQAVDRRVIHCPVWNVHVLISHTRETANKSRNGLFYRFLLMVRCFDCASSWLSIRALSWVCAAPLWSSFYKHKRVSFESLSNVIIYIDPLRQPMKTNELNLSRD